MRCSCGKSHNRVPLTTVIWDEQGFDGLVVFLRRRKARVHVVWDENTRRAAGDKLAAALKSGGVTTTTFDSGGSPADEQALGRLLVSMPRDVSMLAACGTGTIHDLVRYAAYRMHLPFVSVPTATTMDGFASSVAPLVVGGMKVTFDAAAPEVVAAYPSVLNQAPARLKSAGIADMLAKLTAELDWRLAGLVAGESICDTALGMVTPSVRDIADELKVPHDGRVVEVFGPQMTRLVFNGLIASGNAITVAGSSRPASGAEHHLSHYFELRSIAGKARRFLHGESVALGTIVSAKLYRLLFGAGFSGLKAMVPRIRQIDEAARKGRLEKTYGAAEAARMFSRWKADRQQWPSISDLMARLEKNWAAMEERVRVNLGDEKEFHTVLKKAGIPTDRGGFGVSAGDLREAVVLAKEIRPRYTVLSLLDQLGILESAAKRVV